MTRDLPRRVGLAFVAVLATAGPALARQAPPLRARVQAVAEDRIYLAAGRAEGVRPGAQVAITGRRGTVVRGRVEAVTEHGASIALEGAPARVRAGDVAAIAASAADAAVASHARVGPVGPPDALHAEALARVAEPPPLVVAAMDRGRARVETRAVEGPKVSGTLALSTYAMRDLGPGGGLDYYQVRLDSRLSARDLLGGRLDYDHRVGVIGEFGETLSARTRGTNRPIVRADWLSAMYRPDPRGLFRFGGGRLLPQVALVGPLDGARVGLFGKHGGVALLAGAAARPDDLVPEGRTLRFALEGFGAGRLGGLDVRADGSAMAGLTSGKADRTALSTGLVVRKAGLAELAGYAELGMLPDDLRGGRSAVSLDRGHAFLSAHPSEWLDVSARYALDRPLRDRQTVAALPADYLTNDLRQVVGGSARLRLGRVGVEPFGDYDLSDGSSGRWRAGGRLVVDRFPDPGTRLVLSGQRNDGVSLGGWGAGARLAHQLEAPVDLWLGYDVTVVDQRALAEAYALHAVSGGVQWMLGERLGANLEGNWDRGAYEEDVSAFLQVVKWF